MAKDVYKLELWRGIKGTICEGQSYFISSSDTQKPDSNHWEYADTLSAFSESGQNTESLLIDEVIKVRREAVVAETEINLLKATLYLAIAELFAHEIMISGLMQSVSSKNEVRILYAASVNTAATLIQCIHTVSNRCPPVFDVQGLVDGDFIQSSLDGLDDLNISQLTDIVGSVGSLGDLPGAISAQSPVVDLIVDLYVECGRSGKEMHRRIRDGDLPANLKTRLSELLTERQVNIHGTH